MPKRVTTSTPVHLLREHLRADSLVRERSVSAFVLAAAVAIIPFLLVVAQSISLFVAGAMLALLGSVALYESALLLLFRRHWFHPAVAWVNVLIEVSVPIVAIGLLAIMRDTTYYASASLHVLWGAMVALSALRASPRLSVTAGVWAAVLYIAFFAWGVHPRLPPNPMQVLSWPAVLMRSFFLIAAGAGGGMVAWHFVRKAEDALRSVREQDLMGKYFLHEQLGAGGMAEVYRATYCPQGGFQKTVAIKRVLPRLSSDPEFTGMFLEEAGLCALLAHPNVVQVFDCGRFQDTFILAMEYVDGAPLNRILLHGPLPVAAATYVAAELAAGLDYLHRRTTSDGQPLNLVHRDVNPPNILVSRLGEVKLADFGVAHAATRVEANFPGFFGKTRYAAPEQLRGFAIDHRADLFALGLTLYEALTGEPAFGSGAGALLAKGQVPLLAPPSRKRPEVPEALDALVLQLLAADRDKRPSSGAEVRARLLELTGAAAPYPGGQRSLAGAVEHARTVEPPPSEDAGTQVDSRVTTRDGNAEPLAETRALRVRR